MTEKLAAQLANIAVDNGIIKNEDNDLYIYSYQIMIERTLSWTCILLISLIFRTLPYTLLFIVFFGMLRMFTGGWHASNFRLCFISSVGTFIAFSFIEPLLTKVLSENVIVGFIIFCGLIIGILGPIEHPNKPMEPKVFKRCRIISALILAIELLIAFAFFVMKHRQSLLFVLFSFAVISGSLFIAHCKVKKQ